MDVGSQFFPKCQSIWDEVARTNTVELSQFPVKYFFVREHINFSKLEAPMAQIAIEKWMPTFISAWVLSSPHSCSSLRTRLLAFLESFYSMSKISHAYPPLGLKRLSFRFHRKRFRAIVSAFLDVGAEGVGHDKDGAALELEDWPIDDIGWATRILVRWRLF